MVVAVVVVELWWWLWVWSWLWLMVEVVVVGAVDVFWVVGYIILLYGIYYFIVLKTKIDPLLQHVCM